MSLVHTLSFTYRDTSGTTISQTLVVSGDAEVNLDSAAVSIPCTLTPFAWAATLSQLQCLELYCTFACIIETNESVSVSHTDLVVDGSNDLKVTSVGHSFVSGDVGKYVVVTAGAGWTVGAYKITSVVGRAALFATSPGATSLTGGTYHLSDDYIPLTAGQNLIWATGLSGNQLCPFNFNVTEVYLSIAASVGGPAYFRIRSVQNL
jgi:hypothetical protein